MQHTRPICYLGDDTESGAAIYLAGIMAHFGIPFEHINSTDSPPSDWGNRQFAAYVFSDYPRERLQTSQLEHVVRQVSTGTGLVMIGGWESFHGRLGEYHTSPLAEVLPVTMLSSDDRRNYSQPVVVRRKYTESHPILDGLPWETPPCIGGYNLFTAKPNTQTLLESVRFEVHTAGDNGDTFDFSPVGTAPLLVVGHYGLGRVAALATDVAPHWIGGFVDWGKERITQNVGDGFIEVGADYGIFFRNLICWIAGS